MASEKKIEANRRNAQKSTGPRTEEGKRRSAGNATKHGLTAKVRGPEGPDAVEQAERERAWGAELNPGGSAIKADLVRLAARAYGRADRALRADDAEAARRVRGADSAWEKERAEGVVAAISMLKDNAPIAVKLLESTAAGCDWMIETWRGLHAAMDGQVWKAPYHLRSKQLLGCEEIDPKTSARLPDVWQETIELYMASWREERTPIAVLPWHERVLTVEGLVLATQRDHDMRWDLFNRAQPMCTSYKQLMLDEIARIGAIRARLVPMEEADRAGAAERALVDGSDAGRLRLRYIGESQRDLLRLLKEVREVDKHAEKFGAGEAEEVGAEASRNEATEDGAAGVVAAVEGRPDVPVKRDRPKNPPRRGRKKR